MGEGDPEKKDVSGERRRRGQPRSWPFWGRG